MVLKQWTLGTVRRETSGKQLELKKADTCTDVLFIYLKDRQTLLGNQGNEGKRRLRPCHLSMEQLIQRDLIVTGKTTQDHLASSQCLSTPLFPLLLPKGPTLLLLCLNRLYPEYHLAQSFLGHNCFCKSGPHQFI